MNNHCPKGAPGLRGIPAPLRVRLTRQEWAKHDFFRDRGLVIPADIQRNCNLAYGPYGEWNLLDVYRPMERPGILPVIVSVHGGGYFYGDKELYQYYCMSLAQRGFAVVNFNYRLAPEHRFPAPLEDLNAVLQWVCAQAASYGLDPTNVFLVGDSAGAQLASQYAALWSDPAYAVLFQLSIPPLQLRAIGLNCGMYDMLSRAQDTVMKDYLGPDFSDPQGRLDVLSHVHQNYPPTYLISAPNDFLYENCAPMAAFLQSRGVEAEYHIYGRKQDRSVGHVFHINLRCPEGKQANADQIAFFKKHLQK